MVMSWYGENATAFSRDFGTMTFLVEKLNLTGAAFRIFMAKLAAIHETAIRMAEREAEKKRK